MMIPFAPYDHPLDEVVLYVSQGDSCTTPHTLGRITLIQIKTDMQKKTDASARKILDYRLRPERTFLKYRSTTVRTMWHFFASRLIATNFRLVLRRTGIVPNLIKKDFIPPLGRIMLNRANLCNGKQHTAGSGT